MYCMYVYFTCIANESGTWMEMVASNIVVGWQDRVIIIITALSPLHEPHQGQRNLHNFFFAQLNSYKQSNTPSIIYMYVITLRVVFVLLPLNFLYFRVHRDAYYIYNKNEIQIKINYSIRVWWISITYWCLDATCMQTLIFITIDILSLDDKIEFFISRLGLYRIIR